MDELYYYCQKRNIDIYITGCKLEFIFFKDKKSVTYRVELGHMESLSTAAKNILTRLDTVYHMCFTDIIVEDVE